MLFTILVISKWSIALKEIKLVVLDFLGALSSKPYFERFFILFWMAGPFLLLIERSVGDVWMTLIGIAFVVRTVKSKCGHWLSIAWVRFAFLFWFVCIFSSLASEVPTYSFGEAIAWFRFPLFSMAVVFWLAHDWNLVRAMFLSTALGCLTMSGILLAEFWIVGQRGYGRLYWPYGDPVPGNYLAKVCLPTVLAALMLAFKKNVYIKILSSMFIFLTVSVLLLTGERINFLIMFCSLLLALAISMFSSYWRSCAALFSALIVCTAAIFTFYPNVMSRLLFGISEKFKLGIDNPYYLTMKSGLIAFEQNPLLGVGPGALRVVCKELVAAADEKALCLNHPHNFYLQLAGEVGVLGLIAGVLLFLSIIKICFQARKNNFNNPMVSFAFIVPLAFFWPIATTADFFGQWNNTFMWTGISLALMSTGFASHLKKEVLRT